MSSLWSTLMSPFLQVVSFVLVAAHSLLVRLGGDPQAGLVWAGAIALLVLVVRAALLPVVAHQVRTAHAAARARPALAAVRAKYQGQRGREALLRQATELRAVRAENGVSQWALVPLLAQAPVFYALFLVLREAAAGTPVGAMTVSLTQSVLHASVFGASLARTLVQGGDWGWGTVVVAAVAVTVALITYLTNRHLIAANLPAEAVEGVMGTVQRLMPAVSALMMLGSATVLPFGVLLYWLVSAVVTTGQQLVVNRWAPTPSSRAFAVRAARLAEAG
jgi:YidC/Oxa1 family membrane protein insertase